MRTIPTALYTTNQQCQQADATALHFCQKHQQRQKGNATLSVLAQTATAIKGSPKHD